MADTTADEAAEAAGYTPYSENGVMNVLLIGTDARSDGSTDGERTDSMMICSLNRNTGKITLVSLMRDMYVDIAGDYGTERLNAAYEYGGMETLDETVQQNFRIDINGNMLVDFDGFLTALTSVGNLHLTLTQEEADYLNANPGLGSSNDVVEGVSWNLTEGDNELKPEQVLAYSRMRYIGNSDWDRTTRQRKVIQAVVSKLKKNPLLIPKVADSAAPSLTTDMTDAYLTRAIVYALLCGTDMNSYLIPEEGQYTAETTAAGAQVLVPDLDACRKTLRTELYETSGSDKDSSDGNAWNSQDGTETQKITDTQQTTGTEDTTEENGTDPSMIDPTTGEVWADLDGDGQPDVDMDHDGIPDSWGDTW